MSDDDDPRPRWSRRAQDLAAVAWPSFLVAAGATGIFFATFDPRDLASVAPGNWPLNRLVSRLNGYTLGFFFFWLVSAGSSLLTLFLLRTRPRRRAPLRSDLE